MELSTEQRQQIAVEEFNKENSQTLAFLVMLKLAKLGISTNAENVEINSEATFEEKRYKVKMTVEYDLINSEIDKTI